MEGGCVGLCSTCLVIVFPERSPQPPDGLLLIHLPDGPTAHFKLTNFRRGYDIKVCGLCSIVTSDLSK